MLTSQEPLSLLVDFYELAMAQSYFRHRIKTQATFDLFVRRLPKNRAFLVLAGVADVLRYLRNLKFDQHSLDYLERLGFQEDFLTHLGKLRFHGDVWAMPEGAVFFANEPVLRLTGALIELQIAESFCLNAINFSTMIATKAARIVEAARGRDVYDFSLRRTHGIDAALKAARSSALAGFSGTSNVLASKLYGIRAVGTMAHSFVMSFSSEAESFKAFFETFPDKCILLVDTYDTAEGIRNAIRIARDFKARGHVLKGIRLDSGDLCLLSKIARKLLDTAGFKETKILASGDLDEYKIELLMQKRAPIDAFGVGTKMGVSADAPSLDVIYKISEVSNSDGVFFPVMKLSRGKASLPGRKQVFRIFDKNGFFEKDIIGLESERLGVPLLKQVVRAGEPVSRQSPLEAIRKDVAANLGCLKRPYKVLRHGAVYPVQVSPRLKKLMQGLATELKTRQVLKKP
ncbi:MAG: nicotinate phosphoribosyltransferase [Candidatus Omnitrophota bacterium]